MKYNRLSITELHELLKNKEITPEMLLKESITTAHEIQGTYNPFVTIIDDAKPTEVTDDLLSGIPFACKDNLSTKGILTTASSNTLKDYVPFYDATVIKNLKSHNAIMMSKTVMDELGMGGTGTTGHTGIVRNPWNKEKMTAGSSAGSACAVAAGVVPYALGSDTGDSIRKPAAYCGVVGYKPTYGIVSRYGLFAFASSLDHVGCLTRNVLDAAIVIDNMKSLDPYDMTSIELKDSLVENINNDVSGKKLFYIKSLVDINNYPNPTEELKSILNEFDNTIKKCISLGMSVEGIDFDEHLLKAIYPTYVCISCAEATSNDSNLTGIIFGPRGEGAKYDEMMKDHRTKGFSPLIKRRFVIGSYVLQKQNQEKYFINAKRVRRLLVDKLTELFKNYDGLILPCSGSTAKDIEGSNNVITGTSQVLENHLTLGNFGGFPSITIPNGLVNDLPIGINITGGIKTDATVLNIANKLEATMDYKNQIAKEVK